MNTREKNYPARSQDPMVLIVDDETLISELVAARFRRLGYRVTCFTNGADALDWLRQCSADLIVSDLRMPFVDGLELCRVLVANPATSAVPVVLLTADSSPLNTDGLTNLRDVVRKPFSAASIVTRCVELLELSSSARDL